ncbi:MAG: ABC transporter substrate-binding protein [Deltaproteobacteria bacterium]|nr:ABC transporter substrate-binding protein [Deltaproteobacteria bacterium]
MNSVNAKLLIVATCVMATASWLVCAENVKAQPAPVNIGVLTPGLTYTPVLEGLREGLAKLGYREGKNFAFSIEDTKGDLGNLPARAAKLLEAKPDLIFVVSTAITAAAKRATQSVPIVFSVVGDPLQAQFIASYASSRNNLTGVSTSVALLTAKRLELLKELAPRAKSIMAIVSINEATARIALPYLDESAKKFGYQVVRRDVANLAELEKLFAEKWSGTVDAVFPLPGVLLTTNIGTLAAKVSKERLPMIVNDDSWVKAGAMASYGTDYPSIGRQSAKLVVKVLRGAKPADVPVEPPEVLVLSLNRSAAKAIGLKLPDKVLERADNIFD